jgi:ParB family chromosome partitioning protein
MEIKHISPNEINLKDERFRISYFSTLEKLVRSIAEIGLVHPPLLAVRDGQFIIVSGWRRVLACLVLSLPSISVTVSEEQDDLKLFLYSFYENLAFRELTQDEKAEAISRLTKFGLEKTEIMKKYLPLLNASSSSYILEVYLAIARLEPELKAMAHEKEIAFSVLQQISEFNPEDRLILVPLLLPLGKNKQREVIEDLREVCLRDGVSIGEIFKEAEIQTILDSEKLSSLQKSERIRSIFRKKRYPALSSKENTFRSSLKKMDLPEDIMIKHSPFFEDENISVTFKFKKREEYEAIVTKLKELTAKPEFDRIIK